METLKAKKKDIKIEYIRFCADLFLNSKNALVKEDFAKHFIEHKIGCFGYFNNDYFIVKDLEAVKDEIIEVLKGV